MKTKELGPVGGRVPENFLCRSANAKFSNFPDELSKNDELREYELSGSGYTVFKMMKVPMFVLILS